jgi:bla regulator protein blaR1
MDLFFYLLKVNIILTIIWMVYNLLFKKTTFFSLNRMVLMSGLLIAFLFPLLNINTAPTGISEVVLNPVLISQKTQTSISEVAMQTPVEWSQLWIGGYLIISGMMILRLIFRTIIVLIALKPVRFIQGVGFSDQLPTFSFFHRIVINKTNIDSGEDLKKIIVHEKSHVAQGHSLDVMAIEIVQALCWFNPVIYGYKKEIKNLHEYLADRAVLKNETTDSIQYSKLIVMQGRGKLSLASLANSLSKSQLKKRIMMMNTKKTTPKRKWAYLMLIPFIAVIFLMTACGQNGNDIENTAQVTEKENTPQTYADGLLPEESPDTYPEFPGGQDAMMKYLSSIKYPDEAIEKNIEGQIYVEFMVEKDGSVQSCKAIPDASGQSQILIDAAIQHVLNMPKWEPGTKDGQPVLVKMVLPFQFKLK